MESAFLIFDIGKTNKKCFLFNEEGTIIENISAQIPETVDDDGFPCEDLDKLSTWIFQIYNKWSTSDRYYIKGINFACYGASLVHIDWQGKMIAPFYNYLKKYSEKTASRFLSKYFEGSVERFAIESASPFEGMLNSGLQLYWLKNSKPEIWEKVQYSLHFPQYISFLFSQKYISELSSIGCHTGLWNFRTGDYHEWVRNENLLPKLAPIHSGSIVAKKGNMFVGAGLHDSTAALIPYLRKSTVPFMLISTGTWCVCLNPFNHHTITTKELQNNCLFYLQPDGRRVKASRIFLGREHEMGVKLIAKYFQCSPEFYKTVKAKNINDEFVVPPFNSTLSPQDFDNEADAYYALIFSLALQLKATIQCIISDSIRNFYVDGGFARNAVFMRYLHDLFPGIHIQTAELPEATAVGALTSLKEGIALLEKKGEHH